MTRKCCVRSCGSRLVNMHKFPQKNTKRFKKWVLALRNPSLYKIAALNEDKYLQVCYRHFSPNQWIKLPNGKRKLHILAVPDINLEDKTVYAQTSSTVQTELIKQEYMCAPTIQNISVESEGTKYESIAGSSVKFFENEHVIQESPVLDDNIVHLPTQLVEEVDSNMTSLMECMQYSELCSEGQVEKIPQHIQQGTTKAAKQIAKVICGICLVDLPLTGNLRMDANVVTNGTRKAYNVLESISKFKYSKYSSRYACANCFVQISAIAKFQTVCNKAQEYCEMLKRCAQVLADHKYNLDPSVASQSTIDSTQDSDIDASDTKPENTTSSTKNNNNLDQSDDQVVDEREGYVHSETSNIGKKTNDPLACKHCGKKFKLASNLLQHESYHTKEKSYKCSRCNGTFWEEGDLRRHLKNRVTSTCEYCSKQFCIKASYRSHLKMHATLQLVENMNNARIENGVQKCKDGKQSKEAENIAKQHLTPLGYLCNTCGRRFKIGGHFLRHLKAHAGAKSFECEYCGKGFWTKSSLNAHKQITFACGHCSSTFCTRLSYNEHAKTHSIPHLCATCGLAFSTVVALRTHERAHRLDASAATQRTPKYTCKYCGQQFWRNIKYATHVDQHEDVPKYACRFCGKKINTLRAYRAHESAHKAKGTFPCGDCDKVFSTKRMLQRHAPTHSDERRLMCNYCGKTFRLENSYRYHMKIHTRKNLYKCQDCDKEFVQRLSWKLHVARFHASGAPAANVGSEQATELAVADSN